MEKIRLAMKDDVEVTSKKSLRENWDLERIVSYYRDGSLHRFLTERWCKGEAAKVEQLENIADTRELQRKLCEIFDMPFVEEEAVDVEEQERRESLQRKIDILSKKMRAEKQEHRKFELFQQIKQLKTQL